ncbi:hypothetical protein ABE502_04830 [Stenotrophomonas sepilia]|uniref:hypothetical protein n=1 Tax=Stenotrophomonas sepilia TaxID=2860290 RepID=UPI00320ABFEC
MSYPLRAFKTVLASQAAPGSLFRCKGRWSIKVDAEHIADQEVGQMLMLDGPDAGALALAPKEEALVLADGFDWAIFVDDIAGADIVEHLPAVRISRDGALLYGHLWGHRDELQAVTSLGQPVKDDGDRFYIQDFSIWLVDEAKHQVGSQPLLRVSRPA